MHGSDWSLYVGEKRFVHHEPPILTNRRLDYSLDRTLLLSSDSAGRPYSETQRKIIALYPPTHALPGGFRLLRSMRRVDGFDMRGEYVDIRLCDLRHLIDHLGENGIPAPPAYLQTRLSTQFPSLWRQGCLLRSIGMSTTMMTPPTRQLSSLPVLPPIDSAISPISCLLGVPLRICSVGAEMVHTTNDNNTFASYMMLITDVDDDDFGTLPES
jgi:hypothetical protein